MRVRKTSGFLMFIVFLFCGAVPCFAAGESVQTDADLDGQPSSADIKVPRDQLPFAVKVAKGWRISPYSAEGLEWMLRGAEEGDVYAQFDMGKRYYEGLGVPVDYAEAEKWFLIAAENGHEKAQAMLELMREKGQVAEEPPEKLGAQGEESPAD